MRVENYPQCEFQCHTQWDSQNHIKRANVTPLNFPMCLTNLAIPPSPIKDTIAKFAMKVSLLQNSQKISIWNITKILTTNCHQSLKTRKNSYANSVQNFSSSHSNSASTLQNSMEVAKNSWKKSHAKNAHLHVLVIDNIQNICLQFTTKLCLSLRWSIAASAMHHSR